MCLAIPGKIQKIENTFADVDFSGIKQSVSLELVPTAKIGDYIMVHAGYAIEIVDDKRANETFELVSTLEKLAKASDNEH